MMNKLFLNTGIVSDMEINACKRAERFRGKNPVGVETDWIKSYKEGRPATRCVRIINSDGTFEDYFISSSEEICSFREAMKYSYHSLTIDYSILK